MSIYIKGVEMPKDDEEIIIRIDSSGTVMTEYALPIPWAKAVPVPPHGDLIDRDALMKRMWEETDCMISVPATFVRDSPTIIPAEEGER